MDEVLRLEVGEEGARSDFPVCYFSSAVPLQIGQRLRLDKETYTVDHEVHDGLGHEVCDGLVDDLDVGVHEAADGLHLPLQLWVHGDGVSRVLPLFTLKLEETEADKSKYATSSACFLPSSNPVISNHLCICALSSFDVGEASGERFRPLFTKSEELTVFY